MAIAAEPDRSPFALLPPLASIALVSAGVGLFQTLLPLRLSRQGFGTDAIGLVVTAYAAGFILGCLGAPFLIRSVGHVRAFSACAAVAAIAISGFEWQPPPLFAPLVMAVAGGGGAGLSVVTESWLNELAAPAWRGRLLTAYVLILALFAAGGQLVGLLVDPAGSRLLILGACCYVAALIPVAAIDVAAPKPPETARLHLLKAFRVSPVGALSCLHTGLVAATFTGIGPLYGERLGLDTRQIVLMMAWAQGGMALQWPLGLLSDRFDRRYLLILMSLAVMALAGALIAFAGRLPVAALFVLFGSFVGVAESYYPIGVAHANDRARPEDYVTISSNLLLLWALGRMAGPLVGTAALKQGGPAGLAWYALILSGAFALFATWRVRTASRLVEEEREEFVAYPATSPTVFEWIQLRKLRRNKEPAP